MLQPEQVEYLLCSALCCSMDCADKACVATASTANRCDPLRSGVDSLSALSHDLLHDIKRLPEAFLKQVLIWFNANTNTLRFCANSDSSQTAYILRVYDHFHWIAHAIRFVSWLMHVHVLFVFCQPAIRSQGREA